MNKFYILLVLFTTNLALGQGLPDIKNIKSPDVNSLGLFGKTPVSFSRGTVDINIPLYNLEEGDIQVPIYLTYNSSGVKVNQTPGIVGLNWALNAGGMITRITKGHPDETKYESVTDSEFTPRTVIERADGYLYSSAKLSTIITDDNALYNFIDSNFHEDFEPDEFIFNFNGMSGRFYFSQKGEWIVEGFPGAQVSYTLEQRTHETIVDLVCENPIGSSCAAVVNTVTYDNIASFTLKMHDGLEYYFEEAETSFDYFYNTSPEDNVAWYLTKIVDPKNNDMVSFEYQDKTYFEAIATINFYKEESELVFDFWGFLGLGTISSGVSTKAAKIDGSAGTSKQLIKIESTNFTVDLDLIKSVQLQYEDDKIKAQAVSIAYKRFTSSGFAHFGLNTRPDINAAKDQLNTLEVRSKITNKLVKAFYFDYTKDPTKRLYLKEIKEKGVSPYLFEYNNEGELPGYLHEQWLIDHWGYYNNKANPLIDFDYDLTPTNRYNYEISRVPDTNYTKYGSLHKIIYPTGGNSVFLYENNKYLKRVDRESLTNQTFFPLITFERELTAGGLRIKKIENYTSDGQLSLEREFTYENGVLPYKPVYYIPDNSYVSFSGSTKTGSIFSSAGVVPLMDYGNIPVQYSKVTEHFKNGMGPDNGKIEYFYSNYEDFSDSPFYSTFSYNLSKVFPSVNNGKARGKLLNKKIYDASNSVIQEETNYYSENNINEPINAIKNNYYWTQPYGRFSQGAFYTIPLNEYNLTRTEIKSYLEGGQLLNTNTYAYDDVNNLKSLTTNTSDGNSLTEKYEYARDLSSIYEEKEFIKNLGISKIIQTTSNNLDVNLNGSAQTYSIDEHGNLVLSSYKLMEKSQEQTLNSPILSLWNSVIVDNKFKNKITYNKYNAIGKLVEYTIEGGSTIFQLWGYNNSLIVGKIEGDLTYDQILLAVQQYNPAFSSLEVDFGSEGQELNSLFDYLRSALPNASITSYIYDHGIGVSSITDPRGQKTKFIYENNKLVEILDNQNNILKEISYNYKNAGNYSFPDVKIQNLNNSGSLTVNTTKMALQVAVLDQGSGKNTYKWTILTQEGKEFLYKTNIPSLDLEVLNDFYPSINVSCEIYDHYTFKNDLVTKDFTINRIGMYLDQASNETNYLIKGGSGEFNFNWIIDSYSLYYGTEFINKREFTTNSGDIVLKGMEPSICADLDIFLEVVDLNTGSIFNTEYHRASIGGEGCPTEDPIPSDCFIAGTKILMSNGEEKNIEEIRINDKVLTYNTNTNLIEVGEVLELVSPVKTNFAEIQFANGIINTNTLEHPYYIKDKGWSSVDPNLTLNTYGEKPHKLEEGDYILYYDLYEVKWIQIQSIRKFEKDQKVYNLKKVSKNHNYFANKVLVHNKSIMN